MKTSGMKILCADILVMKKGNEKYLETQLFEPSGGQNYLKYLFDFGSYSVNSFFFNL